MDKDGFISNGELFQVLKMMVGNNLKDAQLQQIVDKTILHSDLDGDGKISFEEFCNVGSSVVASDDESEAEENGCHSDPSDSSLSNSSHDDDSHDNQQDGDHNNNTEKSL